MAMEKKSYMIQRNLLGRIKNEMDACYRSAFHESDECEENDDQWGNTYALGKVRAYANMSDYIEGLIDELENEKEKEAL